MENQLHHSRSLKTVAKNYEKIGFLTQHHFSFGLKPDFLFDFTLPSRDFRNGATKKAIWGIAKKS
jgi:hypothetical protein